MMSSGLPEIFSKRTDLEGIKILNDIHAIVDTYWYAYSEYLKNIKNTCNIQNLPTETLKPYMYMRLLYVERSVWEQLTAYQKSYLAGDYFVITPDNNNISIPFLKDCQGISISLSERSIIFQKDFDFVISGSKEDAVITFMTDPYKENWDKKSFSLLINGRTTKEELYVLNALLINPIFDTNWHYRKMGFFINEDFNEDSDRAKCVSHYLLKTDRLADTSLWNSLLSAQQYGAVCIYNNEIIKDISSDSIITDFNTYVFDTSVKASDVYKGKACKFGESFVKGCLAVSQEYPLWNTDPEIWALLNKDLTFQDNLKAILATDSTLEWTDALPIRLDVAESRLFQQLSVAALPTMHYYAGRSPRVMYSVISDYSSVIIYSTLDVPYAVTLEVDFDNTNRDEIQITIDGNVHTLSLSVSGQFELPEIGITGKLLNTDVSFSSSAVTVSPVTHAFTVSSYQSTDDASMLISLIPAVGSTAITELTMQGTTHIWLSLDDLTWVKGVVTAVLTEGSEAVQLTMNVRGHTVSRISIGQDCKAIIYQSYNGEAYRGIDDIRDGGLTQFLSKSTRFIEIIAINETIFSSETVSGVLSETKRYRNVWKRPLPVYLTNADYNKLGEHLYAIKN